MIPQIVLDITLLTGEKVLGPPTNWQVENQILATHTDYIAAVNPNFDLLVFSSSQLSDWHVVNVSAQTATKIVGSLTNWNNSGRYYLAGRDPSGDLIVFEKSLTGMNWSATNVSSTTGYKISTSPTSWTSTIGSTTIEVENLAALGDTGQLLVFSKSHPGPWQVVNLTAKTGATISGEISSWVSVNGITQTEHLTGSSPNGLLLVFSRTPQNDWNVVVVDTLAGGGGTPFVRQGPIRWIRTDLNRENIIACGQNNRLYVYTWIAEAGWVLAEDVTQTTGVEIAELGTLFQITTENETVLTAKSLDGSLLQFWHTGYRGWQAYNVSQATGSTWAPHHTVWVTISPNQVVENAVTVTPLNQLLLISDYGTIRHLTDYCSRQFQLMKRHHERAKLVVILWDPHRPTDPAPPATDITNLIFGQINSVRDYFRENSGGSFTIESAGVFGWFDASRPPDYWWGPPDTTDADGDGWVHPHVQKWAEAIRFADPQFDYAVYDKNPLDGDLRPDELGVLIVIPQNIPFGTNRDAVGREFPQPEPLVVDGVTIGRIAEVYTGKPPNLGAVAHELTHLFLHHGDMYWTFYNPYAAGYYSLMDGTYLPTHLDPFCKLKFGWLRPQLITRSGHYSLKSIETERFVWILMNPARSIDEYYIVENRWRGNSYDKWMPDAGGLAIWHIMEDPVVFNSVPPPPKVPPEVWAQVSKNDGVRRGIRFLRPLIGESSIDDTIALRDGADPVTGFDVLSNDANPAHSSLKWADGTPSGFSIRNISPAGQLMTADIEVPF